MTQRRLTLAPKGLTASLLQILDGVTLANLDVTSVNSTGSADGSLLGLLDRCTTPFGE